MMEYVVGALFVFMFLYLALICVWALWIFVQVLYSDMIIRRQQINESRKKWKNRRN